MLNMCSHKVSVGYNCGRKIGFAKVSLFFSFCCQIQDYFFASSTLEKCVWPSRDFCRNEARTNVKQNLLRSRQHTRPGQDE